MVGFGPLDAAQDFDGVALSVDGVDWYEIQALRSLRSDRFTSFDLDLSGIAAGLGLQLGSAVRIRFCQYDNNPAPKDGVYDRGVHAGEIAGLAA